MLSYSGKRILITGGSKGIGLAIARELASRGASVFLVARTQSVLVDARDAIAAEFPTIRSVCYPADVADYAQAEAAVAAMVAEFGGIDGLVNNAGIATPRYFEDIPPEEFDHIMRVDYLGSVHFTKAALPHLTPGSFIAFTSSVAGYLGVFGYTSYCPAKFAQIGFAEALQQELKPKGIHVAVLCPPDTQTPGFNEENKTKPFETRYLGGAAKLMAAEDVACIFLDKLARGQFLITVNRESAFFYRVKGIAPSITRRLLNHLVAKAQRKKSQRL